VNFDLGIKPELQFTTLGGQFCLTTQFLGRRFECPEATHFFHDSFGIKLVLQTLESAINGLSLADDYFRHKILSFAGVCEAVILPGVNATVNRSTHKILSDFLKSKRTAARLPAWKGWAEAGDKPAAIRDNICLLVIMTLTEPGAEQ
jgi:hypothetical protein